MGQTIRRRALWLSVLLLLVLSSCAEPEKDPALDVAVYDGLTGRPLVQAKCRLPRQVRPEGTPSEDVVYSDAAGHCRFADWAIEKGDTVHVTADGYQAQQANLAGAELSGRSGAVTITVSLFPDRVVGVVLDDYSGEPTAGAEVRGLGQQVTSDDAGQFTLLNPSFPFSLTAVAPGYEGAEGRFSTTTVRLVLRPNTLEGTVTDRYAGQPIAGATVTVTGSPTLTTTTGPDGRFRLEGLPVRFQLAARAPQYHPEVVSLERTTQHDLSLRPAFLKGLVLDQEGQPLPLTRVVWAGGYLHADERGRFFLEEVPEDVVLQFLSPGHAKEVVTVTESSSVTVRLAPFDVQGIYITSHVASTEDWFDALLDFVAQTELNAVVIEVKDAYGTVAYGSQVPLVTELGTSSPRFDVGEVLRRCKERGIYTIAYIVTFEDSNLADARPEWAIQSRSRNGPWRNHQGLRWTDPYRTEVWEYNVALARELAGLGFDEVQFDYIRFPTDGDTRDIVYAEETSIEKQYATIAAFLQYAYQEIAPTGAFISADVFGYAAWRKMWEQGQDISLMTHYLDYLCPMAYPSHYSPGELGCANPNACPYEIVLETLRRAYAQMIEGQRSRLRPWLQDFDLGPPAYGPAEVQAQILAAHDMGASGWLLWNAGNVYTTGVDYSPWEEAP